MVSRNHMPQWPILGAVHKGNVESDVWAIIHRPEKLPVYMSPTYTLHAATTQTHIYSLSRIHTRPPPNRHGIWCAYVSVLRHARNYVCKCLSVCTWKHVYVPLQEQEEKYRSFLHSQAITQDLMKRGYDLPKSLTATGKLISRRRWTRLGGNLTPVGTVS